MRLLIILAACLAVGQSQLEDWENYNLIWSDEFDTFDMTKWDHEVTAWGGGNSEFETYTQDPMNSYVQDGLMYIRPTPIEQNTNPLTGQPFGPDFMYEGTLDLNAMYGRCTNSDSEGCLRGPGAIPPIMSGRIRSAERFSFKYGRVQVLAKMPTGDWLWPAIWMLPEDWVYGGWPASGEIDIVETKSNEDYKYPDGVWAGFQHMGATLHWGPSWDQNRYYLSTAGKVDEASPYGRNFHLYELDWSEDGFRFVIDNVEILNVPDPLIPVNPEWTGFWDFGFPYGGQPNPGWSTTMAPFDQEFHFVMNVAVGGTNFFFPEDGINRGGDPQYQKPWSNSEWYYDAFHSFWYAQENWYWTWTKEGDDNAMQVDYIRVFEKIAK